jgi:uncharacterized membrane protein
MSDGQAQPSEQRWDKGRIVAFSDGVFAIAITLLVREIRVDPADYDHLAHALVHQWPAYLAYVTSFLTVGSVWIAHHRLFTALRFVDPVLLRINLLLLMAAAFLPFPTAVMAQAFHASDEAERTAIAFYGASALVMEVILRAIVRYARSRPDLVAGRAVGGAAAGRGRTARLARVGDRRALRAGDPRRDLHLSQDRRGRLLPGGGPRSAGHRGRGPAEPARAVRALDGW